MKFEFSPGLFGYGPKGTDGSDGIPGGALYFTDFNPYLDMLRINTAIANNEVLLSQVPPGTILPGGREYITGDLVVVYNGDIYEIDAENDELSNEPLGTLSKSNYFTQYFIRFTENGYERYSNIYDGSTNYIFDSVVFNNNAISYTSYPTKIYGILPKNYARIEYTNAIDEDSSYNAFTVYSSGESTETDDHKSIAIVRDPENNLFRLGNLDDDANLRDVTLVLDVSSLIYKKEDSNLITINSPSEIVLTNREISTNLLFDDNFTRSPGSFRSTVGATQIDVSWNLASFTSEPSIIGTLTFYQSQDPSGVYNIDASIVNPLILHDLETQGTVSFTDLPLGTTYEYFITIDNDGWERQSAIKFATTSATTPELTITDPSSLELTADASGMFTVQIGFGTDDVSFYTVEVSTNSATGWRVTDNPAPNWISMTPTSGGSGESTFDVSLLRNTEGGSREGIITVSSEVDDVSIKVTQEGTITTEIYFTEDGSIIIDNLDAGSVVDISLYMYAYAYAEHFGSFSGLGAVFESAIRLGHLLPPSLTYIDASAYAWYYSPSPRIDEKEEDINLSYSGVTDISNNYISVTQDPKQDSIYGYSFSNGYVKITNAEISGVSIDIIYNKFIIDEDGNPSITYEA
jgi:hypothetical protein